MAKMIKAEFYFDPVDEHDFEINIDMFTDAIVDAMIALAEAHGTVVVGTAGLVFVEEEDGESDAD